MNNLLSNNPRFYLWGALALLLLLNFQTWMRDYAPPPGATAAATTSASAPVTAAPNDLGNRIPDATTAAGAKPAASSPAAPVA